MLMVCVLMVRAARLALDFSRRNGSCQGERVSIPFSSRLVARAPADDSLGDSNGRRLWEESAVHGGVVVTAAVKW